MIMNYVVLHGFWLFINLGVVTTSVRENGCNFPLDESMIQWTETGTDSVVTVTLSADKNQSLCNSEKICSNVHQQDSSSTLLQYYPVTLQYGEVLRILIEPSESCPHCIYQLHKVSLSQFLECGKVRQVLNSSLSGDTQTTVVQEPSYFADFLLDEGFHFLIVEVPESDASVCELGLRLNVTIKDELCSQNSTTDLCSGHGLCTTTQHQTIYSCRCCKNYTGQFCEQRCQDQTCSDICNHSNCLNGGTCIVDVNRTDADSYSCLCPPSRTGRYCETPVTGCMTSPCIHGICQETTDGYQCYCVQGFHGKHCELEYNECLSSPCRNHGTCIDLIDSYECMCTHGHTGRNCEKKIDLCHPNPCHYNASCTDLGDTVSCVCPVGITGPRCESSIRECESHPCHNQGTCIELERGFECRCPITFAGLHCEYMMDVFAPALDRTSVTGESHIHNLYIVAGTLCAAICLMAVILLGCYCKMHETYKQLTWRRVKYKRRSLSCPDLESYGKTATFSKSRLSVDAMLEATSLCYDNTSYDTPLKNSLPVQQI